MPKRPDVDTRQRHGGTTGSCRSGRCLGHHGVSSRAGMAISTRTALRPGADPGRLPIGGGVWQVAIDSVLRSTSLTAACRARCPAVVARTWSRGAEVVLVAALGPAMDAHT